MEVPANGSIPLTWNMQDSSEPLRMMDYTKRDGFMLGFPQLLAWGLNSYAPVMCIFGLFAFLKTYFGKLQSLLEDHFTSTLHVKATDETYDMLLAWGSSRGLDNSARSIIAQVGAKWKPRDDLSENGKKPICFSPWNGTFLFRFNGQFLSHRTQTLSAGLHKEEVITITCLGRSVQVLKDLIEVCRDEYLKQNENKMAVFKHCGDYWQKTTTKDKRPLSTVITDEAQKQELVDDMKDFLNPRTQTWYAKRSIPYRRGYLLHGPPGTGKSSLASAVAAEFGLDIRAVSIPSVDDQKLEGLFNALPERCLVLMEDIDAVGADRSHATGVPEKTRKTLSLSGLLNTLDGVASQEGRVLIMTTNHIEKLDKALIRPGRIDKKIKITLADSGVIAQLFCFIFGPNTEDSASTKEEVLATNQLAAEFATKIPALEFSTAQIMSHLLEHKDCPKIAVQAATNWVKRERGEKQAKSSKMISKLLATEPLDEGLWMKSDKKGQKEGNLKKTDLQITPPPSPCDDVRYLCKTPTPAPSSTEKVAFHLSKSCNKKLCHLAASVEPPSEEQDHDLHAGQPTSNHSSEDYFPGQSNLHYFDSSKSPVGMPVCQNILAGPGLEKMAKKGQSQGSRGGDPHFQCCTASVTEVGDCGGMGANSCLPLLTKKELEELGVGVKKTPFSTTVIPSTRGLATSLSCRDDAVETSTKTRAQSDSPPPSPCENASHACKTSAFVPLSAVGAPSQWSSGDGDLGTRALPQHDARVVPKTGASEGAAIADSSIQQHVVCSDMNCGLPPISREYWLRLSSASKGSSSSTADAHAVTNLVSSSGVDYNTGYMAAKIGTHTETVYSSLPVANGSSLQEMQLDQPYKFFRPLDSGTTLREDASSTKSDARIGRCLSKEGDFLDRLNGQHLHLSRQSSFGTGELKY